MKLLKKLLTKETHSKYTVTEGPNHLLFILGFLLFPVLVLLYIIFAIFKLCVATYLHLKLGDQFHGLLSGADAMWAVETKEWRNIIPIIYFVKSETEIDILSKTKKQFKERVFDQAINYRKLTSTYHNFLGYIFLKYNTYTLEECAKPMEYSQVDTKYITEDDLKDYVQQHGQSPLPKNDKALWEVLVSLKPILRKDETGETNYTYPILVKIHHMVGDGAALVAFADKIFGSGKRNTYLDQVMNSKEKQLKKETNFDNLEETIKYLAKIIGQHLYLAYVWIGSLLFLLYVRERDNNALHGPNLSGEKIVTWTWEDNDDFVPLVKKIKNYVPNTSFNDVVYTALSGCLSDYFDNHKYKKPNYFLTAVPVILSQRNISKPGPAVLKNDFSMVFFKLPSKINNSLSDTFFGVKEQFSFLKSNLHDIKISYLTVQYVMNPLPLPIIAALSTVNGLTFATSNLPGGDKGTTLENLEIENSIFFTLNRWKTGVTASIITYGNRFHLTFLVDKILISSRAEVHKLATGFFENLKLLANELNVK